MSIYNKINAGFKLGSLSPITSGIEDLLYLYNEDDFVEVYDINNPLIITGLFPLNGAKLYKFEGTNNSFGTISKLVKTAVGPRYTEEIDFNIAGNTTDIKGIVQAAGYGRIKAIAVNNYKQGDSTIELFGAVNGLLVSEAERNASDESIEGGYKIKLTQPDKLREPYPPRSVFIPISGAGISATVPLASSATVGTAVPTGVTATGSTTGGTLAAATYYYKVVSVDSRGVTTGSLEANATTTGATSSVNIAWTAAPGAVSYRVYKGTASNTQTLYFTTSSLSYLDTAAAGTAGTVPVSNTAIPATVAPGSVTATLTAGGGLATVATYYKVTSVDALGETIGSSEVTATPAGSNLSITIAWASAVGAVSYRVYRGTGAGLESVYFTTTALSFLDSGVVLPATYANSLAAIDALVAA